MASFNEQKLKDCVKHYGIDPNSVRFTPTRPGQNGIFSGYTPADKERNLEVAIVNDVTSYNSKQIDNIALVGAREYGVTLSRYGGTPDGKRDADGRRVIIDRCLHALQKLHGQ